MSDEAVTCTCNCMDCIEGMHCGVGYPNPDGQPTLCLEAPGRGFHALLENDYDYEYTQCTCRLCHCGNVTAHGGKCNDCLNGVHQG